MFSHHGLEAWAAETMAPQTIVSDSTHALRGDGLPFVRGRDRKRSHMVLIRLYLLQLGV